jgi:nucleotide-binding universal stress UspA family protein
MTLAREVNVYRNILIPTDGTELSKKAIPHAVALARLAGAVVTGVIVTNSSRGLAGVPLAHIDRINRVIDSSDGIVASIPTAQGSACFDEQSDMLEEVRQTRSNIVRRALDTIEAAAKACGVRCETIEVQDEHPFRGIVRTAAEKGCDLIVMASHGRRGIAAVLIGSETQKVVAHASIPVLVHR